MIKYILIGAATTALCFITAGFSSHIRRKPPFISDGENARERAYRFYLGCFLLTTLSVCGAITACGGFYVLSVFYFALAAAGAWVATVEVIRGLRDRSDCGEQREALAVNENKTTDADGAENDGAKARSVRIKALIWGAVFVLTVVLVAVFYGFTSVEPLESDYRVGGVTEMRLALTSFERVGDDVILYSEKGNITCAVLDYGAELYDVERLTSDIDGERIFIIRGAVLDRGEWSGYLSALSISSEDGALYLAEDAVLKARAAARNEKLAVLGGVSAVCGCACMTYVFLSLNGDSEKKRQSAS